MAIVQTRTIPRSSPSRLLLHAAFFFVMRAVRNLLHRLTSLRATSPATHAPSPPAELPDAAKRAADGDGGNAHEFRRRLPPGSWDSHMHVLDPRFPLAPTAVYTPGWHTTADARAFEASVGLDKVVVVQPSIYGTDNGCTLEALRAWGPERARAVVAFDPARTPPAQLRAWHRLGVRGVRLNLQSVGRAPEPAALAAELARYADAVRPLGWVLQVYAALPTVAVLEPLVPRLGVRVCIDHLGHPTGLAGAAAAGPPPAADPYALPGFAALVRLLRGGRTWVKLSAAYRFSGAADGMSDAVPLVRELLRVAGRRRVVFATDWPHTRYEGLDIRPWLRLVLDLCADADADADPGGPGDLVDRVFRANPDDLWGASGPLPGVNQWEPEPGPDPAAVSSRG